jgi:hypothetical protein
VRALKKGLIRIFGKHSRDDREAARQRERSDYP